MDLYGILRVDDTATPAQIKAAYRRLAKTAHPDVGGDPGAFEQLKLAYDVLRDPERRARYNKSGETAIPQPTDYFGPMLASVANMVQNILAKGADPMTVDLLSLMRVEVNDHRLMLAKQAGEMAEMKKRLTATLDRFHTDGPDNPLRHALTSKIEQIDASLKAIAESKDFDMRIQLFLDGYRYEFDRPMPVMNPYQQIPSDWSGIFGFK
jgi:curved DNA-binding protein CbpA